MISKIDPHKCTGCELCTEVCIMDVLRMDSSGNKAFIAYPEDCQLCYQCELECPTGAIKVVFSPIKRPLVIKYGENGTND